MNGFTLSINQNTFNLISNLHIFNGTVLSNAQFVREIWNSKFENLSFISSFQFIEYVRSCSFTNVTIRHSNTDHCFARDIDKLILTNGSVLLKSKFAEHLQNSVLENCHLWFESTSIQLCVNNVKGTTLQNSVFHI